MEHASESQVETVKTESPCGEMKSNVVGGQRSEPSPSVRFYNDIEPNLHQQRNHHRHHRKSYPDDMATHHYWCFFDVEATGPSLRDNFVPCLGVAVVVLERDSNSRNLLPPRLLEHRKWYMKPPSVGRTWNAHTVRKFWMKPKVRAFYAHVLEMLQNDGALEPWVVMTEFVDMVRKYSRQKGSSTVTLLSDTSGFDFAWLHYYLSHFGPTNTYPSTLFGYYKPVRDISSYFAGVCGALNSRYPHQKSMSNRGIADHEWRDFARSVNCPPYNHDPENDASHIALRSAWIVWRIDVLKNRKQEIDADDNEGKQDKSIEQCRQSMESSSDVERGADSLSWRATKSLTSWTPPTSFSATNSGSSGSGSDSSDNDQANQKFFTTILDNEIASPPPLIALVARTDLRMSNVQTNSHCSKAVLSLLCALCDDDARTALNLKRCTRSRFRSPDAATMLSIKRAAHFAEINYVLYRDQRRHDAPPTVLAIGPADAARIASLVATYCNFTSESK